MKRRYKSIFNELDTFFDEMEHIGKCLAKRYLEPLFYIEDNGTEFIVTFELPGVRREDIALDITENTIEIKAKLKENFRLLNWGTIHKDLSFHSFHKVIGLPFPINPKKGKAIFRRGILELELPKKHRKRRVEIK